MKNLSSKILISFLLLGIFLTPLAPAKTLPNSLPVLEFQIASAQTETDKGEGETIDFNCGFSPLWGKDNLTGCLVAILYYVVFVPLAFLARLAAGILDFFIYYSISSEAYNNEFVSKAWGTVRDVANIFFLLALIYVAIKTILGLNVSDNKRIISYIIIVALLINFSLFITQVIIDSSNVLARIFYNQIESVNANGNPIDAQEGEKSITVNLVKVFEPQRIIGSDISENSDIGYGFASIVIILMAIFCGVMIYVFLVVSILFVSRVVSLWMSMIFAPLAFASYTVPFKIPGFGHEEWWSGLLKNAFLAMVFIFFLYMISVFGGFVHDFANYGSSSPDAPFPSDASGRFLYFMNLFIPFFIIMAFLLKAKTAAEKMAGETGKALTAATKSTVALGGIALGGALAGGAMLSRATAGATMKMVTNDKTRQSVLSGEGFKDLKNKKTWLGKGIGAVKESGRFLTAGAAEGLHKIGVGGLLQKSEKTFADKKHGEHELDAKTSELAHKWNYTKDTKFKDLSDLEKEEVKKEINKDTISKKTYKRKFDQLTTEEADTVDKALKTLTHDDHGNMSYTMNALLKDPENPDKLKYQDRSKTYGDNVEGAEAFIAHGQADAVKASIGEFVRAMRTGTHDIRNISSSKATASIFNKAVVGISSSVASIVRGQVKNLGVEYGKGGSEKSFFVDLGNVIKESVDNATKKMKVDISIDTKGGHGGGGGDKGHGGGGGAHH